MSLLDLISPEAVMAKTHKAKETKGDGRLYSDKAQKIFAGLLKVKSYDDDLADAMREILLEVINEPLPEFDGGDSEFPEPGTLVVITEDNGGNLGEGSFVLYTGGGSDDDEVVTNDGETGTMDSGDKWRYATDEEISKFFEKR